MVGSYVNIDAAPLIVATMPSSLDDAFFERFDAEWLAALERVKGEFATVLDASALTTMPTARQRRAVSTHMDKTAFARSRSVGVAFVLPHPLVRAALSAILLVSTLDVPLHVAATREEAIAWCVEELRRRNLVPEEPAGLPERGTAR